ncbi:unnamed protein product [Rhizophagus irregularis]|nr:unnamed protein product [Rhizophagus irregularis]
MSFPLPIELLREIFINLHSEEDHADLFCVAFVNREWCKTAIPLLWESPFYSMTKETIWRCLNIRTYISGIKEESRKILIENGMDLRSSPVGTAFDYTSYLQKIDLWNIKTAIRHYLIETQKRGLDFALSKTRLLFQILYMHFLDRSRGIKKIVIKNAQNMICLMDDLITLSFLKQSSNKFSGLKEFHSDLYAGNDFSNFYKLMSGCSKNIVRMNIHVKTIQEGDALATLVKSQNKLKHLKITSQSDCYIPVLQAIEYQKSSILCLRLKDLNFQNITKRALEGLISCNLLRSLSLLNCTGFKIVNLQPLSFAFPNLQKFEYGCDYNQEKFPEEFIIGIIQTSGHKMKKLIFNDFKNNKHSPDLIHAIKFYCPKIQKLKLQRIAFYQALTLFQNCIHLKQIHFDGREIFDTDSLLYKLSQNVPPSLEIMEIIMLFHKPWKISPDTLEKFLKNSSPSFKLLKIYHDSTSPIFIGPKKITTFNEQHFNLIKKYGVKLYMSSSFDPEYINPIIIPEEPKTIRRKYQSAIIDDDLDLDFISTTEFHSPSIIFNIHTTNYTNHNVHIHNTSNSSQPIRRVSSFFSSFFGSY